MNNESPIIIDPDPNLNINFHHGGLRPAAGVKSYQVFRANRENPNEAEGYGWTYNHAPMLAYWNNTFFIEYLSTPKYEHVAPGQSLLTSSKDGKNWTTPKIVFPQYNVPMDVYNGESSELLDEKTKAVMHQRMGFHISSDDRLLVLGFYGICPKPELLPFRERGIGRVIREIYRDFTLGPIYFIRYNTHAGWNEDNTHFPLYTNSPDKEFIKACNELLQNKLVVQQWIEEHGPEDELIALKGRYKAFSYYTTDNGKVIGYWKWSLGGISSDYGKSWDWLGEIPTLHTAGGKVWGQKISDGKYALVYNPSTNNKHRWPLAVVSSDNGFDFHNMLLVNGEVPPRRHIGGKFKDFGQNYVRGISEGNGIPPDGDMWVTYSMNKEDIWISRIPAPITGNLENHADDDFDDDNKEKVLDLWNIYRPYNTQVEIKKSPVGKDNCLMIEDFEPYDYVLLERIFPDTIRGTIMLSILAEQYEHGELYIEIHGNSGQIPLRLVLNNRGLFNLWHGRGVSNVYSYKANQWYDLKFEVDCIRHRFRFLINGEDAGSKQSYQGEKNFEPTWYFLSPVDHIYSLVFRTGPVRFYPTLDTQTNEQKNYLPYVSRSEIKNSKYYIKYLKTSSNLDKKKNQ